MNKSPVTLSMLPTPRMNLVEQLNALISCGNAASNFDLKRVKEVYGKVRDVFSQHGINAPNAPVDKSDLNGLRDRLASGILPSMDKYLDRLMGLGSRSAMEREGLYRGREVVGAGLWSAAIEKGFISPGRGEVFARMLYVDAAMRKQSMGIVGSLGNAIGALYLVVNTPEGMSIKDVKLGDVPAINVVEALFVSRGDKIIDKDIGGLILPALHPASVIYEAKRPDIIDALRKRLVIEARPLLNEWLLEAMAEYGADKLEEMHGVSKELLSAAAAAGLISKGALGILR